MAKVPVYISLGGNLGDPYATLQKAVSRLSALPGTEFSAVSRFYLTSPLYITHQPPYINAVCRLRTELDPYHLYQKIEKIELDLGKIPKPKNEPRPIDLDLLFYGSDCYNQNGLDIPHPRWRERLFVLIPLADLTETLQLNTPLGPQHFVVQELIDSISDPTQSVSLLEKNIYP